MTQPNDPTTLVPMERQDIPVDAGRVEQLHSLIQRMIRDGWTDSEIMYDLNRSNGVSLKVTGQMFCMVDTVALVRKLVQSKEFYDHGKADPATYARGHSAGGDQGDAQVAGREDSKPNVQTR